MTYEEMLVEARRLVNQANELQPKSSAPLENVSNILGRLLGEEIKESWDEEEEGE